jgi:hypothetical protein
MVRATLVRLDLADAEIPGENFSPLMQRVKEVPKSLSHEQTTGEEITGRMK